MAVRIAITGSGGDAAATIGTMRGMSAVGVGELASFASGAESISMRACCVSSPSMP